LQHSGSKKSPPTQQEIERHYFELFQKAYPLPAGTVGYGDKPDVTITGPRVVGIEITNLYLMDGSNPSSEQVQAQRRSEAVARGQEIYEGAGGWFASKITLIRISRTASPIPPKVSALSQPTAIGARLMRCVSVFTARFPSRRNGILGKGTALG
jgi:hypothetical protein